MIIATISIYNCGTHTSTNVSSYHFVLNTFHIVNKTYIQTSLSYAVFIFI